MTKRVQVTIARSTRTDVDGALFAQVRKDGAAGPHTYGDRDQVHAWIKRLEDSAERNGYTVELVDETK